MSTPSYCQMLFVAGTDPGRNEIQETWKAWKASRSQLRLGITLPGAVALDDLRISLYLAAALLTWNRQGKLCALFAEMGTFLWSLATITLEVSDDSLQYMAQVFRLFGNFRKSMISMAQAGNFLLCMPLSHIEFKLSWIWGHKTVFTENETPICLYLKLEGNYLIM